MREILFRGKHTRTGEWIEGLLWKKKYNHDKLFISCFPDKDDNEEIYIIKPETVGQYTGLTDKNGTKIFEGDIVKIFLCDGYTEIGYIRYKNASCRFEFVDQQSIGYVFDDSDVIEGIGNIHDNPELLEGGE